MHVQEMRGGKNIFTCVILLSPALVPSYTIRALAVLSIVFVFTVVIVVIVVDLYVQSFSSLLLLPSFARHIIYYTDI